MHLAWVIPGPLEQTTGGYIYDRLIIERMRAAGDHVEVVRIDRARHPLERQCPLARALTSTRSDAVVADALAAADLGAALPLVERTTPRILLVHHLASWECEHPITPEMRAAERAAITACDHIVTTSRWTAERLAAEHRRNASVVLPGADRLPLLSGKLREGARLERSGRDQAGERKAGLSLLFVGSIVERKRLGLLLEALDCVRAPEISLRVVGDSERDPGHAATIAAQIAASPYLRPRVTWLGAVSDAALAEELALGDALVLPSSLEGYGMAAVEALRAGMPVIAARAGAIPEAVSGGDGVLLFDDRRELAQSLQRFATDPVLRARLRSGAEARAASLPSWRGAAVAFRQVLTDACAARSGASP
jgi:glycosyltransferase involved in cell wall biosynthesis